MELRIGFHNQDEWHSWSTTNALEVNAWRQRIAASVRTYGIIEPISGLRVSGGDLRIDPNNYRESISHNGLNSRKRALLLELDLLRQLFPRFADRNTRIFSPEALSRTALILRGIYPYYLGTEYLPSLERRIELYPITHADLTCLDMPSGVYDIVITGDVLEFVPDLYRCLQEISRVLRPGGALLSTFPFAVNSAETIVAAKLDRGTIVHLSPPTYHGDPLSPEGALVFAIPGWDVLEMCRNAGLEDAHIVMHASSEHGILADATIGVLVLSAMKTTDATRRTRRSWIWEAERINRVVGVLGPPRSGTTMFTAVLDAHKDVTSIYEPWNASKAALAEGRIAITMGSLIAEAEAQDKLARTMVIKETTANFAYPKNLALILDQVSKPLSRHVIIILRNPFHCFLSEVEGRRKWWGEASLEVTPDLFTIWAKRTLESLSQLIQIGEAYGGLFVFYEACVSQPQQTFTTVMEEIGLDFKHEQLQITKNSDLSKVRGDLSLVENARDVGDVSVAKRELEFDVVHVMISASPLFGAINGVSDLFARYADRGTIGVGDPDRGEFVSALADLITSAI